MPSSPPNHSRTTSRRIFRVAFWVFAAAIGFAIAGTLLLKLIPSAARFFAPYIAQLVNVPTLTYMGLLPVLSFTLFFDTLGWKKSIAFVLVGGLIGLGAELIGTNTGFPFGAYGYTNRLGPKILGDVPWFIPFSWYALSILCYDLARRLAIGRVGRILAVAVFMILWDVSLDPAMNQGGGTFVFWAYPDGGAYFGMPLSNWAGWFVTSALIGVAYEALGGLAAAPDAFEKRWSPILYALHLIFPISVCLLYGLPLAGLLGLVALGIPLGLLRLNRRPMHPEVAPA